MIKVTNIQATRIMGVLLILLSGDAFAVRAFATLDGLNTEITNRKSGDSTETARATKAAEGALKAADTAETTARDTAIGAEVTNRNTAIATEKDRAIGVEGTLTTAINSETARAKAAEALVHIVGESYQGGIIFWVEPDGQHGLIAAKADQNGGVGIRWYNGTYFATNATADGIYAGAKNTEVIISTQTNARLACSSINIPPPDYCSTPTPDMTQQTVPPITGDYAALVAAKYRIQDDGVTACATYGEPVGEVCFGDWYLPSQVELFALLQATNLDIGLTATWYWSSTERSVDAAHGLHKNSPQIGNMHAKGPNYSVRVHAIRRF
jgi:hypothetical protein